MVKYVPETTMASLGPHVWKKGIAKRKFEEIHEKWLMFANKILATCVTSARFHWTTLVGNLENYDVTWC